jgi:putative ABC transport system permease protein
VRPGPKWPTEIARDVDEEIASHLELRSEEYAQRGMDPDAARQAALLKFGNRDDVADACRLIDRRFRDKERRTGMLTDLRQDLGYAVRMFRRTPGFATIAVLTLALGMGATTTIFTLANWALLRPVPGVTDPTNVSVIWVGTSRERGSFSPSWLSYPNLGDVSSRTRTLSIGAYQGGGAIPVAGGGQAARNIQTQYVTGTYFDVLGVRMQLGRPFTAAEDTPPSPLLGAVISDRLWQTMFQRSAGVLEKTLDIAGVRFAILGVAAPGFHGTERLSTVDVWVPGSSQAIIRHMPALRYDARNSGGYYELVARLKPGADWPAATTELESLRAWLRDEYPKENSKFVTAGFHVMGPIGPPPLGRTQMQRLVGPTAFGAAGMLMLIACANVAGLLLIKGLGRRHETAVRKALGAGRGRLLRQHVAEGLLLWVAGGAGALAILFGLRRALDIAAVMGMGTIDIAPPIDWRVLAFTAAVSLAVGIVFSILPAIRATRAEAAETLRATAQTSSGRNFVGTSLTVFQLGAALTLLVGAFLLVGTLRHLASVPLGFDARGLYIFMPQPAAVGYDEARSLAYLYEFQRRLRTVPGVQSATVAKAAPFQSSTSTRIKSAEADPQARPLEPGINHLFDTQYFSTLGIPLLRGRGFTEADIEAGRRDQSRVVMLSDGLARRLFGNADPIGREVRFPVLGKSDQRFQVIGVVGTARYRSLISDRQDMVYEPAPPNGTRMNIVMTVRAAAGVRVAEEARRIAADLNPSLPLTLVWSMDETIGRSTREWDSLARLLGILGGLAAVLACIGLYGVVAHGVAARRREFGIRAALGASRRDVWGLVLRQSATIIGGGIAFGLVGAYAFAQVLSARLVGVTPLDPVLWSLAAFALVAAAAIATIVPAHAATRVNVTETLRAI